MKHFTAIAILAALSLALFWAVPTATAVERPLAANAMDIAKAATSTSTNALTLGSAQKILAIGAQDLTASDSLIGRTVAGNTEAANDTALTFIDLDKTAAAEQGTIVATSIDDGESITVQGAAAMENNTNQHSARLTSTLTNAVTAAQGLGLACPNTTLPMAEAKDAFAEINQAVALTDFKDTLFSVVETAAVCDPTLRLTDFKPATDGLENLVATLNPSIHISSEVLTSAENVDARANNLVLTSGSADLPERSPTSGLAANLFDANFDDARTADNLTSRVLTVSAGIQSGSANLMVA